MNVRPESKYLDKITESGNLILQLSPGDDLNNDKILLRLLNNKEYFIDNYFDIVVRHRDMYNEKILPLIENIRKVKKAMEGKILDTISTSNNPIIAIANILKTRSLALFERIAAGNDRIATHYIHFLEEMDRKGFSDSKNKKRVIAISPDGEETVYDNPYKAATDLLIHSGSITKCCQGTGYRISAVSKKDGTRYKFRYEGESLKIKESTPKKPRRQHVAKIDKLISSFEQSKDLVL